MPGFAVDHAAEVGLVGESDVGGESGEVGFAVREAFEREAGSGMSGGGRSYDR